MCGRFNVTQTPGLDELLRSLGHALDLPAPLINVAPTEQVWLLANDELRQARWWLTPHWSKSVDQKYAMFNARCERLGESPAFRKPFACQRGIVPMSSFIEWRKGDAAISAGASKVPWLISNEESALAVAALWDIWKGEGEELLSCTLVTTEAAPALRPWHNRMPVLLDDSERDRWLDNTQSIEADDPLFNARLKTPLLLHPLASTIGNARAKSASLLEPVGRQVRLVADQLPG